MNIEATILEGFVIFSFNTNKFTKLEIDEFNMLFNSNFSNGNKLFVINFKLIDFMDSSALGAMVNALKKIENQGDILVAGLNQPVLELFKLTRMDKIFKIYENVESAMNYIRAESL